MITLSASEIIRKKIAGMQIGLLYCKDIAVVEDDLDFNNHFTHLKDYLEHSLPDKRPSNNKIVGHVRRMYLRIGWEPTQYRPSSEALVRRILKGKGLYRINNLVDYGNLVSAEFFLPMGLYDLAYIQGPVTIDVGNSGETYDGISRDGIRAEGKMILRDDTGIFGNPTADSKRTSINLDTKSVMALFFCPPEVEEAYIYKTLDRLAKHYKSFSKAKIFTDVITI